MFYSIVRGLAHGLRDLLFPQFRDPTYTSPTPGVLERGFAGEDTASVALRLRVRDFILSWADAAGLPALYARHPDAMRNAIALFVGLLLLGGLLAVNACASCTVRCVLRRIYREQFVDGPALPLGGAEDWRVNAFFRGAAEREAAAKAGGGGAARPKAQ